MKSKYIILLLCSLLFSSGAWAIWTTQESGTAQDLNAIFFTNGALGFSVGGSATILKTATGGTSWETKSTGAATIENDVFFPISTEGYVLSSSGVLKSTDKGDTYTPLSFGSIPGTANFRKGSSFGTHRALVASNGASSDSYLIESSDSGSSWSVSTLTSLEVKGVFLSTGGGTSVVTSVWGKYFGGPESGNNVILEKIDTGAFGIVYSNASKGIRDLYFLDENNGYAVGDSGLIIKTTNGGNNWTAITVHDAYGTTISTNLNALYFVNTQFGWVCGDSGVIALTAKGGDLWSLYTLNLTPQPDLRDISVKTMGDTSGLITANAYICGTGGKILKLVSPTFGGISPTAKPQGWIGAVEVTGEGYMSGAEVSFTRAGTDEADPDITVVSTSFESPSKLRALIMIEPGASTAFLRGVLVTNPDATATKESAAFNVTPATTAVSIESIWIDRNKYPEIFISFSVPTVSRNPSVSFEVVTTDSTGESPGTVNARIVVRYTDFLGEKVNLVQDVNPSNLIQEISQPKRILAFDNFSTTLPYSTPIQLGLYGEDNAGNVGLVYFNVTTEAQGVIVTTSDTNASATPADPESGGDFYVVINTKVNMKLPDKLRVIVLDAITGQIIYDKTYDKGTASYAVNPAGDKVTLKDSARNIGIGGLVSAQLAIGRITTPDGRLIARFIQPIIPRNMMRH